MEIPSESEMIIKGPISYDAVGIVKSTEHFVEKTWITNSEGCGAEKSNCIPFRVANLSTEFHVVHKNTIAATCSRLVLMKINLLGMLGLPWVRRKVLFRII